MPLADNRLLDTIDPPTRARPASLGVPQDLLDRAALLLPEDRTIIELTLKGNLPRRDVARLLGLAAGTVSRRIQRIAARLHDPLVRVLLDPRCPLPPETRQIGVEHFLQGLSARQLADKHRLPDAQVRAVLRVVREWFRIRNGRAGPDTRVENGR